VTATPLFLLREKTEKKLNAVNGTTKRAIIKIKKEHFLFI
jgi:hypothetical protein